MKDKTDSLRSMKLVNLYLDLSANTEETNYQYEDWKDDLVDSIVIRRINREYYEQLYVNKKSFRWNREMSSWRMQTTEEEIDNLIILISNKDTEFVVHNFQKENSKTK